MYFEFMRQLTLRVPDDLHDLVTNAAEAQHQSVNTFAVNALLGQVRAKSYGQWLQMVEDSHRAAGFKGVSSSALNKLKTVTGDEDS
jgi:HicB family